MNKPTREPPRPRHILALIALATTFGFGCRQAAQLPPEVQKQLVSSNDSDSTLDQKTDESELDSTNPAEKVVGACEVSEVDWIQQNQLPWNYAEVQYVGNTRTGYSTVTVDQSDLAEFKQLRIQRKDVIDRAVDGSVAAQRTVSLEVFEKPNGEMASFRFESIVAGENELLVEGVVAFEDLDVLKREGNSPPTRTKIPWVRQNWGPFGIQASLMRSPMKTGEIRSAQIFIPQLVSFVPVVFEAKGMEITPLAQGKNQELLQVDLTIGTPESGMLTTCFVDPQGVILKTIARSGQPMLAMQVPLETAQRIGDQSQFALGIARRVALKGNLSSLPKAKLARFIIDAEDQDPFDLLLSYHRQQLKSINADRCGLTINTQTDSSQTGQVSDSPADASMLGNSLFIPTDNELIATLGAELLDGQSTTGDVQKAEALHTALHRVWKFRPIAAEIGSTLVSARERSGSCIEASNVLAALLRREKIPSQVVCGLRIDPATSEAQFHVWNQAWLGKRWVDLDVTEAGPVGVLHIAMSTTAGSAENPYSHFLTVFNMIAQFRGIRLQDSE